MNNLTSDELKAVILANAKKNEKNMRVVLETAAMAWDITKEIKLKFAKKLTEEFEARLGERGYCIKHDIQEKYHRFHYGIFIYRNNWNGFMGRDFAYWIEPQRWDMKEIIYGIKRGDENAPAINGLDGALLLTSPWWHCYDYYPNQYRSWDCAEMLTNMAIEAGMVSDKGEPSYPVADVYVNTMIAFIDKTEGIIDSYIAEKKKGDDNVPF